ncbi:hypothetical protein BHE74_00051760 [Ensete ventricosum]|nr:hypothetical protein BHE74_00051760 [Ensete ventricosum]
MRHKSRHGEGVLTIAGLRGVREGTSPPSAGTGAIHAPLGSPASPSYQRDGSDKFPTLVSASLVFISELDTLKSRGGPEAVTKAEEQASELELELGKTKQKRNEALQRLEASEKELTEVRSNLAEIQRLLKEARVRTRKMDDELLQSVKALESARSELPKQVVDRYM